MSRFPWRRILTPLRFLVSGGLLVYLIWRADPSNIWATWRQASLGWLGLAFLLQLAGVAVSAYKWQGLLDALGHRLPYPWLLGVYLVGQFASNFLPTAVGGDAVRVVQLGRRIESYTRASAAIFVERLTGFVALSLIACGALALTTTEIMGGRLVTSPVLAWATALFAVAAIGVVAATLSAPQLLARFGGLLPRVALAPLQSIADALGVYAARRGALVRAMVISFAFHACWISAHAVCAVALAIAAPPQIFALMVPVTDIVGLVPIFVNNLGARELVFTLYLSQLGVSEAAALALAFNIFTIRLCVSALGGVAALLGGIELRPARQPDAS